MNKDPNNKFDAIKQKCELLLTLKQQSDKLIVMKPRLRETPILGRQKLKSRSQSKSRSKSKKKKQFDPVKYLNSVIDLPVVISQKKKKSRARDISSALTNATPVLSQNVSSAKLKSRSSFSQYRKKQSKESSKQEVVMKDLLNMNLIDIITESELIKFTEESPNEKCIKSKDIRQDFIQCKKHKNNHQIQQLMQIPPFSQHLRMDSNYAATLIQKAWKKYKTLKAVEKYYLMYLGQRKNKNQPRKTHKREHKYNYPNEVKRVIDVRNTKNSEQLKRQSVRIKQQQLSQRFVNQKYLNRQFMKQIQCGQSQEMNELASTLKMKPKIKKQEDRYHQDQYEIQTQKNSANRDQLIKLKKGQTQSIQLQNKNRVDDNLLNWIQTKRKQKWDQIMDSFRQQRNKQIQKIPQIKEQRQKSDSSNLQNIEISWNVMNLFNHKQYEPKGQQYRNQLKQQNFEAHNHKISPLFKKSKQISQSQESYQHFRNFQDIIPFSSQSVEIQKYLTQNRNTKYVQIECQLLKKKINSLEQKKEIQIAKITALNSIGKINSKEALKKISNLQTRFNREIRFVQQTMRQYQRSVDVLSKIAINFHKDTLNKKKSSSNYLKKTFSAGNIILKKILQQSKIAQMKISIFERNQRLSSQNSSQSQFETQNKDNKQFRIQEQQKNFIEQHFSSCSSKSFESYDKIQPKQNQISYLDDFQMNSHHQRSLSIQSQSMAMGKSQTLVRKYTQNLQKQVQKILIDEFISEIYLSQGIFQEFRPHVENLHEFRKISDYDVVQFIRQIKHFYPSIQEMQRLCNQKINPTSKQILAIIRDCDYELEEYELILSQNIFKQYRQHVQNKCQTDKSQAIQKLAEIDIQISDQKLYAQLLIRKAEKITRVKKYKQFEKDLKLIYMKSIFNCLNQFMIEGKSFGSFMNSRSSIGPGQLSMSIREYNRPLSMDQTYKLIKSAEQKVVQTIKHKCIIPNFQNMRQLQYFQDQALYQLRHQFDEGQFRWVNYMDEVLQIWQDVSLDVLKQLIEQAIMQIQQTVSFRYTNSSQLQKDEEYSSSSSSLEQFLQAKRLQFQIQRISHDKVTMKEFIIQSTQMEDKAGNSSSYENL